MTDYQLFDDLDPATEAALRSSIERWGVLAPIHMDQRGNVIDGHQRIRIAAELGHSWQEINHQVADEEEARELARTLNTDRRHLDPEQRHQVVADLRQQGHSHRAIAGALGVSQSTVRDDLDELSTTTQFTEPAEVVGLDGKRRPATREPRTPQPVPKPAPKLGGQRIEGAPPHPASYPDAVLDVFREIIPTGSIVLDPFGGVGRIHELADHCTTNAIELEPEWACLHPSTIQGDARDVAELFPSTAFDVVATSPAYGNRLADRFYNAADPEARRSYAIDLGRPLDPGNGAGMHFDRDGSYERLHVDVWSQVVGALQPEGLFLLNCKDFVRDRQVVNVVDWHIRTLTEFGLSVIGLRNVPTGGLSHTTTERELIEQVVIFETPGVA